MKYKKTGELEIFIQIWEGRPHVSFLTGKPLGVFNVCFFAHVLPKGTYPDMRLNPDNIILISATEHSLLDQGTEKQRNEYAQKNQPCDWSKIYELKDSLRVSISTPR